MNLKHLLLSATLVATATAANVPPVVPPQRRAMALEAAQKILAEREAALPANAPNPFNSSAFAQATGSRPSQGDTTPTPEVRPSGPRTDRQLLAAIAAELTPNGFTVFRGTPFLTFGQKRVKAGDPLTITFEGTEYTLEIVSIDPKHFTLRLNREEFTRPIK
jgi:hypothetical protein